MVSKHSRGHNTSSLLKCSIIARQGSIEPGEPQNGKLSSKSEAKGKEPLPDNAGYGNPCHTLLPALSCSSTGATRSPDSEAARPPDRPTAQPPASRPTTARQPNASMHTRTHARTQAVDARQLTDCLGCEPCLGCCPPRLPTFCSLRLQGFQSRQTEKGTAGRHDPHRLATQG